MRLLTWKRIFKYKYIYFFHQVYEKSIVLQHTKAFLRSCKQYESLISGTMTQPITKSQRISEDIVCSVWQNDHQEVGTITSEVLRWDQSRWLRKNKECAKTYMKFKRRHLWQCDDGKMKCTKAVSCGMHACISSHSVSSSKPHGDGKLVWELRELIEP